MPPRCFLARRFKMSERLKANFAMLIREYPAEGKKALHQEALKVQKTSMKRTPVETGALRGSHETKTKKTSEGFQSTIKVGGPAASYAVAVHYRPAQHAVGQTLFLESAVNEAVRGLSKRLADRIKKEIERKVRR